MRSDFLGDCAQFQGLPEAINEGQYLIPRMTRDERRFAVTGPVGVTRGKITEPLVNRLLNDVGDNPDQLPILQHALMRTWDHWTTHRRNGEPIGIEHYLAIGTMSEALSIHADEAFNELPDDRSRVITAKVFKALTEQGADNRETRRPLPLHQLCSIAQATEPEVVAVIDTFRQEGRSFLMPPAGTHLATDTIIDISHESLIRNWKRLRDWVHEEMESAQIYRRVAESATLYNRGKEGLLSGPFLQIALDWREQQAPNRVWAYRYNPEFGTAISFLDESRVQRDAQITEQERLIQAERERERRELEQLAELADRDKRLAEVEKQRALDRASAQQRELEQAQTLAENQARTATRLKRFTVALVVLSVLALVTAAGAVFAYLQARESQKTAESAQLSAQEANRRANVSLKDQTMARFEANDQRKAAEDQKKVAEQRAKEADIAKRDALLAQSRAERAAENAHSAAEREAQAAKEARDAEEAARKNGEKLQAATDRNRWSRDGLAAFQRRDYQEALNAFRIVHDSTQDEIHTHGENKEIARTFGWNLANIGATQRAMGNLKAAVPSYENALKILDDTLDPDDAVRFDTYHGLADAYLDVLQTEKAEGFYKRALVFLEKDSAGKPSRIADVLEDLARLYRQNSRYAEAEPLYKRIVKIREDEKPDSLELAATLKEVAQFYVGQSRYKEAAALYPKILAIQEMDFISGESKIDLDSRGKEEADFRRFTDTYRDLGEVYIGVGEEGKAKHAYQLARSLQDYWAKLRQFSIMTGNSLSNKERTEKFIALGLDKDLNDVGELLTTLGRFEVAEKFYLIMLDSEGNDPDWRRSLAQTHIKLGNLYRFHLKKYDKAASSYFSAKNLLSADPQGSSLLLGDALTQLGDLYAEELNKPEEGRAQLQEALAYLQLKPNSEQAQYAALSAQASAYRRDNIDGEVVRVSQRKLAVAAQLLRRNSPNSVVQKGWDAGAYSQAFGLYIQAVGDLSDAFHATGDKAAAEAVFSDLLRNDLDVNQVVDKNVVDAYLKALETHSEALRTLALSPSTRGNLAERIQSARQKQQQIEQITRQVQGQDIMGGASIIFRRPPRVRAVRPN